MSRYIELNPVRANMVQLPGEYPWSSYRHNAMGIDIGLITEHDLYRSLGEAKASRLRMYRALFENEFSTSLLDEIRVSINKEWVLAESQFTEEIESMLGRKVNNRRIKGSESLIFKCKAGFWWMALKN